MLRDLREGRAAVFCRSKQAAALRADDGDEQIDDAHEQAAEDARADGVGCDIPGSCTPRIADDLHDDDAECEACQRVHRVIATEEACEERLRGHRRHRA